MYEPQDGSYCHEHTFFDRSSSIRFLIALICAVGIFSFLHFREAKIEILKKGERSPHYIISSVDFSFPDEEKTHALRQEALLDVGHIFYIDKELLKKRKIEFNNELLYNQEWKMSIPSATYDELTRIGERLFRMLTILCFADAQTVQIIREHDLSTKHYVILAPFNRSKGVLFTDKVWDDIRRKTFSSDAFNKETVDYVVDMIRKKIWTMHLDQVTGKKLRRTIHEKIPLKFTDVAAGTRLIDQDEEITDRHLSMLQSMQQAVAEKMGFQKARSILASLLVTLTILLLTYAFLKNFHPDILLSNRKLFLLGSIVLLGLLFSKISESILLKSTDRVAEIIRYPLITPFLAILLCCLLNPSVAIFMSTIFSIIVSIVFVFDREGFLAVNLLTAFFAVLCTRTLHKRTEVFAICGKSWVVATVLIMSLHFIIANSVSLFDVAIDIFSAGAFLLMTAVLVVGLLPILESSFHILTDITLMEYMDPDHPLLRRLIMEAPGTYQHALIMGNIAEAAARAIGANGLFCRVATLYHDIGKLPTAQYFAENQQQGMNVHQLLTPVESAQVIISHIGEGVSLARKAGLPEPFIDIIKEHHGTSLVYYFYHQQLEKEGGCRDRVNQEDFRYSGPKPHSKEAAIIMIVDATEAASRALDEINEATLTKLVEQIVKERVADDQLSDCNLTFEELSRVKKAIVKSMLSVGHFRVKYPDRVPEEDVEPELQGNA